MHTHERSGCKAKKNRTPWYSRLEIPETSVIGTKATLRAVTRWSPVTRPQGTAAQQGKFQQPAPAGQRAQTAGGASGNEGGRGHYRACAIVASSASTRAHNQKKRKKTHASRPVRGFSLFLEGCVLKFWAFEIQMHLGFLRKVGTSRPSSSFLLLSLRWSLAARLGGSFFSRFDGLLHGRPALLF